MNNTREKYAKDPYFWNVPDDYQAYRQKDYNQEIANRLDQMTKELKEIKRILNMETDDGK